MKKKILRVLKYIFSFILAVSAFCGYSANEHIAVSKTGNEIVTGAVLNVQDQWLPYMTVNGADNTVFHVNQGHNNVVLRFDQSRMNNFQTSWSLNVIYTIVLYNAAGTSVATHTAQSLTITFNNSTSYKDKDFLKYTGAFYKAKITITGVTYSGSGLTLADYQNDIFLDLEQETERYYKITSTSIPFVYSSSVTDNELPVAWTYAQGAESYDLEWLFLDIGTGSFTPSGGYDFDFRDASRINTTDQHYAIPLAYPRGIVLYRARAVGIDGNSGERTEGDWSYNNSSFIGSTSTTPSGSAYKLNYAGLDTVYNWQYSAAFAEGGKRKEVINYFDGSLRKRQTSTLLNTEKNALIAETKYDFEGRGAVQILPTPVTSTGIHFYNNFNDHFDKNDFDKNTTHDVPNAVDPALNTTGRYYSNNAGAAGTDAYVPDAEGYPFSRTIYKKDGTNRITKQSGVGTNHKIGSSHETKDFYGTPTGQQELDRLFGNEAGNWLHYKKNMTQDPNGQVSITYLDQEGRTVAASLSGTHPSNLLEIDSKPPSSVVTADLLTGKNNLADDALVSQSTITVSSPGSYDFTYNLSSDQHCETCDTAVCRTCKYDLDITITNEDNDPVTFTTTSGTVSGTASYTNISALSSFTFTAAFSDIGTYTVIKNLKLNQNSLTAYYNETVAALMPCISYDAVTPEPCLDCNGICEQNFKIPNGTGGYNYINAAGETISETDANILIAACKVLCSNPSNVPGKSDCELHYAALAADMSPGGQYFDNYYFNTSSDVFNTTVNDNTWLSANISSGNFTAFKAWLNASTTCTVVSSITDHWDSWDSIRVNWRNCFADYLIRFHPEYCQYQYNCDRSICSEPAKTIGQSNTFDADMTNHFDLQTYYIPTGAAVKTSSFTTDYSEYVGTVSLPSQLSDPYYACENTITVNNCTSSTHTLLEKDAVEELLTHYIAAGTSGSPFWLSVWYVLDDPDNIHSASSASAASMASPFAAVTIPNNVYQMFRNLHGDGTSAHPGILGGSSPLMTKYQYFVNSYLGIKKLVQTKREESMSERCDNLTPSANRWGWTDASPSSPPSFQMRYPVNNAVKTFWDNACYNTTSNLIVMNTDIAATLQSSMSGNGTNPAVTEIYKSNCAQYASQWIAQLKANCTITNLSDTTAIKNYMIDICTYGADPINVLGADHCNSCNVGGSYNSFNDVINHYTSSGCVSGIVFPSANIINQQVSCSCGNYNTFISQQSLDSSSTSVIAAAINDFYALSGGDVVTSVEVGYWQTECALTSAHSLSNLGGMPSQLMCAASSVPAYNAGNCSCTNIHNYIAALSIDHPSYNNDTIAMVLNNEFTPSTAYTASDVAAWLTACTDNTVSTTTFNNAPAGFKCLNQDECTGTSFISFVVNHGFPAPPHTYTSTEKTNIAAAVNTGYSPAVSVTSTDVDGWLTAYSSDTYTGSTFDNMPPAMKCSANGTPPPPCQCEQENLQNAADAAFINNANQLAAARLAAANFINAYKTVCLNTVTRESFTVTYTLDEYYYTLYYYDQAGNLLKTVPPQGTRFLSTTGEFAAAAAYRADPLASGSVFTVPTHVMVTQYWYNSLQQLVKQYSPDGDSAWFYYDVLGRLAVWQNAKQKNYTTPAYSYSLFDALGRVYETGELISAAAMTYAISRDASALSAWITAAASTKNQLTQTHYDDAYSSTVNGYFGSAGQENLRNRVATVTYTDGSGASTYDHAAHYCYDIHGNVKTLIQENTNSELTTFDQNLKRINYDYDLVSGKVNKVSYEDGQADAFYHQYLYDADNRITNVYTSRDNVIWNQDAKYFYYAHGPLARTEIGDKKVQGIDYAYTIQGWQKNINSETLDQRRDMGKDGNMITNNLNKQIARDAFSYTLGYFSGDYTPKAGSSVNALAAIAGSDLLNSRFDLFNGNISYMTTNITNPGTGDFSPNGMAYKYDQLNRIKEARGFSNIDVTGNSWQTGSTYGGKYYNGYTFDLNGNILTAQVKNSAGTLIDDQTYNYDLVSSARVNNRLRDIADAATSTGGYDLLTQAANNYTYSEIGELKSDVLDEISEIKRRVDGKIKEIVRASGTKKNLIFDYDAMGNRVAKHVYSNSNVWEKSEFYVLDAQGNILSTYKHEGTGGSESFKQTELHIYGSSLIGIDKEERELIGSGVSSTSFSRSLGFKNYSGNNHLGNDVAIFTDRKIANNTSTNVDFYSANIVSSRDYGPFGSLMPGRVFNPGEFPYGYNGQRTVDEISGVGNHYTAEFWEYDPRAIHRWNRDPVVNPWESPYAINHNSPIQFSDPKGDSPSEGEGDGDGKKCVTCKPAETKPPANPAGNDNLSGYAPKLPAPAPLNLYKIGADTRTDHVKELDQTYTNFIEGDNHWAFKIPVVGSAAQAGRRAAYGEYALAVSSLGASYLEGVTLGAVGKAGGNLAYSLGGYKLLGTGYFENADYLTRLTKGGYGFGQFDVAHRSTTFLRNDILMEGKLGISNWKTIFMNYNNNGQNFSIGINPWKKTIFHEGPGVFK